MWQQALTFNHNLTLFFLFSFNTYYWRMHLNDKVKKDKFISLKIVEFYTKTGLNSNLGKQTHFAIGSIGYIYFDWYTLYPTCCWIMKSSKLCCFYHKRNFLKIVSYWKQKGYVTICYNTCILLFFLVFNYKNHLT